MGQNPSKSQGSEHPVEQVSWEDCQEFVARFAELLPALPLQLPSETQWEYACRAGTDTSTYAGDLAIDANGHAAGLEELAWYTANAGGETHDVGELEPNAWGLHDTLGNVWEWCRDHSHREYTSDVVTDPVYVTDDASAYRVIRGGGWGDSARFVRAACRDALPPDVRVRPLGFRCSSSGEPGGGDRLNR